MPRFHVLAMLLPIASIACSGPSSSPSTIADQYSKSYDTAALGDMGMIRWATSFGTAGRDMVYGVAALGDASVLVGETAMASVNPASSSVWSGFVRRIGPSGATSWEHQLPGAAPGSAMSVAALDDGGVLVGGFASAAAASWVPVRGVLARFDAAGNVLWSREFSDLKHTTVYNVAVFQGRFFAVLGTAERLALRATDGLLDGDSSVSIVEFDAEGGEVAAYLVGKMRSQDSTYLLASSSTELVYVGDINDGSTLGTASEVISFDTQMRPRWRVVFDDPVLAGISAVLVAPDATGRPVVHVGGHFRAALRTGGRIFLGTTPVRRNGFIAAIDSAGTVLGVSTILPANGGDWATIYALAPLPDGSVLATGEFLGSLLIDGRPYAAVGDLDTLLVRATYGAITDVSVFGSMVRDGVHATRVYADCSALLVAATGGGRNDPNGEDVLLFRRTLTDLRLSPC